MTRRITQPYHCPPPHMFPPAADCSREDLLDIAAQSVTSSWELLGSSPHVEAICRDYGELAMQCETLRDQLEVARGVSAGSWSRLMASRDAHHVTLLDLEAAEILRVASLSESNHLREELVRISEENRQLRLAAAFDTLAITVTGATATELTHQLDIEVVAAREHERATTRKTLLERQRTKTTVIVRELEAVAAYRATSKSLMFDVSDTDVIDEPVIGREQTVML